MNNGGWTDTNAVTDYSPAFDKADLYSIKGIDQRWVPRPQGAYCDVGAYELIMEETAVVNAVNRSGQVTITTSDGGIHGFCFQRMPGQRRSIRYRIPLRLLVFQDSRA